MPTKGKLSKNLTLLILNFTQNLSVFPNTKHVDVEILVPQLSATFKA